MATYKDGQRTNLASAIASILAIEREKLVRAGLGDLSFQLVGDEIDRIRRLMLRLSACDLELVPPPNLQQCSQFTTETQEVFNRMRSFAPMRSNTSPLTER